MQGHGSGVTCEPSTMKFARPARTHTLDVWRAGQVGASERPKNGANKAARAGRDGPEEPGGIQLRVLDRTTYIGTPILTLVIGRGSPGCDPDDGRARSSSGSSTRHILQCGQFRAALSHHQLSARLGCCISPPVSRRQPSAFSGGRRSRRTARSSSAAVLSLLHSNVSIIAV
jgi:hypothetical protein